MATTPEASTVKRTRAKPKAAQAAEAAKKPRSPRKSASETATVEAAMATSVVEPAVQDLSSLIATAAYYLAAERNFTPGHELDDWLEAERRVLAVPLG